MSSKNSKTTAEYNYRNILIIAFTRLGDMLQASHMIRVLKDTYPQAHITILASKEINVICKGLPEINEIITFDINDYFLNLKQHGVCVLKAYNQLSEVINDLRARNFDLCLDISYTIYTAKLVPLLNIKNVQVPTFDEFEQKVIKNHWRRLFVTMAGDNCLRKYQPINLVDINILTAGLKPKYQKLFFTPKPQDYVDVQRYLDEQGISQTPYPLICIQCGTSQKKRQWGAERFAAVAKELVESLNAWIIYPGAPGEQELISEAVACYAHPNIINAAGVHNISQLAALLERADLLITGDTGPMHLAAAMGTPSVSMFVGPSYCSETGPYSAGNIIVEPKISCYACSHENATCSNPVCYDKIDPQTVARLCKLRLQTKNLEDLLNLKLSAEEVNPREMAVKVSYFDKDGFLEFKTISEIYSSDEILIEKIKAVYKQIWKEEFIQTKTKINFKKQKSLNPMLENLDTAYKLLESCEQKVAQLTKLLQRNDFSQAKKMVQEIDAFDAQLINLGKTNPNLKIMTNMYNYEKTSITTNDIKEILRETRKNHATFKRRLAKFKELMAGED
ncbi:MAG: glycosyltransferase family 9 protein [Deltaproteobacteria bacterium]|jgi:ADP-heptose:LPS heptosyltransferase|nr:glycosyltransferase family 9 protein [Deltaproteobacteria bacterium]